MKTSSDNAIPAYEYKEYILFWIEKFYCWCILTERGDKVREPYWSTIYECEAAIDSGEAL